MHATIWRISGEHAELELPNSHAVVTLGDLRRGVSILDQGNRPRARLFALQCPSWQPTPPGLRDFFARGNDLIAYYQPPEHWPVSLELHWRPSLNRDANTWQLDLQISAHTTLLDSDPSIVVEHQFPCAQCCSLVSPHTAVDLQGTPVGAATLCQRTDGAGSLIELVHPSDYFTAHAQFAGCGDAQTVAIRRTIFGERLEKGVIRRVRLRFIEQAEPLEPEQAETELARFAAEEADLSA